jgi:hypothetical protein
VPNCLQVTLDMPTVSCACAGQAVKRTIAAIACRPGFIDLFLEVVRSSYTNIFAFGALGNRVCARRPTVQVSSKQAS